MFLKIFHSVLQFILITIFGIIIISLIPGDHVSQDDNLADPALHVQKSEILPAFYFTLNLHASQDSNLAWDWTQCIPKLKFHGSSNQYHQYLFGNPYSLKDHQSVYKKIWQAFSWTFALQLPAILIIFTLAWLLSVLASTKSKWEKFITMSVSMFHSVPVFWIGALMMLFFCNPDFLNWFPGIYTGDNELGGFSVWIHQPQYFVLPLIALVIPSVANLYGLIFGGIQRAMKEKFWTRAMATGISAKTGLKNEIYPHALIPALGWLASAIPNLMAGSLVIETIFSLPGIGRLMFESIQTRDWPVAYIIFVFSGALTIIGLLIADGLQYRLDPRTRKN